MVEELKQKAIKIFSGLSKEYETYLDYFTFFQDRRWKTKATSCLDIKGKRILDVACGTCRLGQYVREAEILVGVDISIQMLKNAGKRTGLYTSLILADAEHLPFRENAFDIIISCYVPKYVQCEKFLDSALSCLGGNGEIVVYDFVWPEGLTAVPYSFYVSFLFSVFALIARVVKSSTIDTFLELPKIIKNTRWASEIITQSRSRGLVSSQKKFTFGTACMVHIKVSP
jgi:ubiquinone/menaquinone biosynthesis C-methylase UbiE